MYCTANDIKDERKKACLLTQMGARAYRLLQSLVLPAKPVDKSYDDIVKVLKDHLTPKKFIISERFRFYNRSQRQGECINEFVADLKRLTKHCKFGSTLDDMLRDRFVCGLHSEKIQEFLLTKEDSLTFSQAIEYAKSKEAAMKDTIELRGTSDVRERQEETVQKIHRPRKHKKKHPTSVCKHCGKTNHEQEDCYYKNASCYRCKQKGHIASVCSPGKQAKSSRNPS